MRKLGLALCLLLGLGISPVLAQSSSGPPNAILCNQGAQVAPTTITSAQIVALSAGKTIFICGWHVTNTASSGTFQLWTGTGTNCATGGTTMTPAFEVTSTAPATDHIDFAMFSTPTSQALCFTVSTTSITAIVWYSQF